MRSTGHPLDGESGISGASFRNTLFGRSTGLEPSPVRSPRDAQDSRPIRLPRGRPTMPGMSERATSASTREVVASCSHLEWQGPFPAPANSIEVQLTRRDVKATSRSGLAGGPKERVEAPVRSGRSNDVSNTSLVLKRGKRGVKHLVSPASMHAPVGPIPSSPPRFPLSARSFRGEGKRSPPLSPRRTSRSATAPASRAGGARTLAAAQTRTR